MYEVFRPKSELLQQHIVSFNILKKDAQADTTRYFVFPQYGTTIGICKNMEIDISPHSIQFSKSKNDSHQLIVFGKYLIPLFLQYENYIDEVAINFSPTGLNYFFSEALSEIAPKEVQLLQQKAWELFPSQLFKAESSDKKMAILEDFLLGQLQLKNIGLVEQAVALIDEDSNLKIGEIAKLLGISERSLSRNFQKYIGCSPTGFRKIYRFRKAIENKFDDPHKQNLTAICYNNNFYDSPHFSSEFKKLTKKNPRDFFSKVEKVGKDNYPYIFS